MRAGVAAERVLVAAGALIGSVAWAQPAPGTPIAGAELAQALRAGGYVVYFRHTRTLPEHDWERRMREGGRLDPANCDTQRNLSETGAREAIRQGEHLRALGWPVGAVYASAYCRARFHAEWTVGRFEGFDALTPPRNGEKATRVRTLVNTPPPAGTNTLVFAHGGILWQATDYDSVESETFVFRPRPGERLPELVAAIRMEDWPALLAGRPCCAPRDFWSGKDVPPVE